MHVYALFFGLATSAVAQTTYSNASFTSTGTTTDSLQTSSSTTSSSATFTPSQICGVAGYDLGKPLAAAYDGTGLRGTFDTCKAWCTNYLSFAVGSGTCLCYAAPVVGNLNAVPASPNVYFDMSCPPPPQSSSVTVSTSTSTSLVATTTSTSFSTTASTSLSTTTSTSLSTTTLTFTLVSSTSSASSASSYSVSSTTTKTSTSSSSGSSSIANTSTSSVSASSSQYSITTSSSTTPAPTTFITKTTTASTTTTTSIATPSSACFKVKANGQYLALGGSLLSKLTFTTGSASTFYVDKSGYLRSAADNYFLMRSISSLTNWNYGYISRVGFFALTTSKNTNAKTLTIANWWNGVAPVWTSSKDSALQHGASPGNGWSQVTVNYEDVTCPATARV